MHALPRMRVRGIEVPETLLRSYASDEIFDVALVPGGIPGLPTKWANVCVGELRMALRVAAACDYVVFGPVLAAQAEIQSGALVELDVRGWDVSEPLYLACHTERLLAKTQRALLELVRAALARTNAGRATTETPVATAARCG